MAHVDETLPLVRPSSGDARLKYNVCACFFLNKFQMLVIDAVLSCVTVQYTLGAWDKSLCAASTMVGAFLGTLFFGMCGDRYGRYQMFLLCGLVTLFGEVLSAGCASTYIPFLDTSSAGLVRQFVFCRFIVGMGIGGQYPIIAAIAVESVAENQRAYAIACLVSLHGFAMLVASFIPMILLALVPIDAVWRVCILVAAFSRAISLLDWCNVDAARIDAAITRVQTQPVEPAKTSDHSRALFGTSSTWFLMGLAYYGTVCFRSQFAADFMGDTMTLVSDSQELIRQNALSVVFSAATIPGFLLTIMFIRQIGSRSLQTSGFFFMALTFVLVAHLESRANFVITSTILAFTFFFASFGPNATTFILPALCYPTNERSTCHGISGAWGKVGEILAAAAFFPLKEAVGISNVMYSCAICCLLGVFCTATFCPNPSVEPEGKATKNTIMGIKMFSPY